MEDRLVPVYRALTADDAQLLADRLDRAGVEAFVDSTDSPMYGATEGPRSRVVHVRAPVSEQAREIVARFEEVEGRPGVPADEWQREETGLELAEDQRPRNDSSMEDMERGTGRMETEPRQPEAAETEGLVDSSDTTEDVGDERIEGIGADRGLTQEADVERPEVEEQPIDELDTSQERDESETGTPAANLRPGRGLNQNQPDAQRRED